MPASQDPVSYLGETTFHARFKRFGIKQADRLSHLYVIGKTGVGKSTLLETLARQDLAAARGFALIDPHGDMVERIAANVPSALKDRVRYLNAPDPVQPFGYNPLRRVRGDKIPLAASGLLETLKKLWPDAWGVRMEHVLRNSLYALLEREGSVLPDLLRLYADKTFRRQVVAGVRNDTVRRFWTDEFDHYPDRYKLEVVSPIQNKLGALLSDPTLHRILVAPRVDLRFRSLMDEGGVLLVNLAKGRLGEDSSTTLGGLLVSTIGLAALSRAETPEPERRPFILYVDEFQNFTTLSFVNLLSELRKYGLGITIAHQFLHQLEPDIRHAVLGNAGTLISFRVGPEDASILAREFQPTFEVHDLLNLPNRHFYLKLMIDGAPSRPFSARTESPLAAALTSHWPPSWPFGSVGLVRRSRCERETSMNSTVPSTTRFDVYRAITDKIVAAIEAGAGQFVLPWHKGGPSIGRPTNATTGLAYRGVNVVALWAEATLAGFGSGHWTSYRQWQNVGAQVRKGEAGAVIVFFRELGHERSGQADKAEEEGSRRFVAKSSRVFNAEQVDGWGEPEAFPRPPVATVIEAENFVAATGAQVRHGGQSAFYQVREDVIILPDRARFLGTPTSTPAESYYATLLHELTHWSGAKHRLDREFGQRFGDDAYAVEELVADLGAAFLCADLGIANEPRPDHAAYLGQWLTLLKEDARMIFTTARLANRATDFLHELVANAAGKV